MSGTVKKQRKIKKILINITILIFSIIVSVLIAEIILRFVYPAELSTIKPDNYLLYRTIPNLEFTTKVSNFTSHVSLNNYGFAGNDWEIAKKDENIKRIVIVGDSFTAGFSVPYEKHYARLLQKLIENETKSHVEVLAAGVSSWDTSTEIKYLEKEGLEFNPDIVILQFFVNDIDSNYRKGLFSIKNSTLIDNTPVKIPVPKQIMMSLAAKSHLFRHISDFFIFNPLGQKISSLLKMSNVNYVEKKDCYNCNYFLEKPIYAFSYGSNITNLLISKFYELSKRNNFIPVILLIPMKEQIYDDEWQNLTSQTKETMIRNLLQKNIVENSPKEIIVVDLYGSFIEKNINNKLYYGNDLHTNVLGNQITAEELFNKIKEEGILNAK